MSKTESGTLVEDNKLKISPSNSAVASPVTEKPHGGFSVFDLLKSEAKRDALEVVKSPSTENGVSIDAENHVAVPRPLLPSPSEAHPLAANWPMLYLQQLQQFQQYQMLASANAARANGTGYDPSRSPHENAGNAKTPSNLYEPSSSSSANRSPGNILELERKRESSIERVVQQRFLDGQPSRLRVRRRSK
ncbi:hypothetical protein AAVH_01214 [Aphelenchoides avenae]|nr:hypothetical protein AAVH_01214 [Aphelenchus avenae]